MNSRLASEGVVSVSVIIATHNRAAQLRKTLDALLAQKTPANFAWEIIIVNNGSSDETHAVVRTIAERAPVPVRCLFEPMLGKSRALNTGISAAHGTVIALTDDDVSPTTEWVATAAAVLDKWDAEGAGGRILPQWEAEPSAWLRKSQRLRDYLALMEHDAPTILPVWGKRTPQVWGANMVFRRAALQALGGFDIRLGPIGRRRYCAEDCDIVQRMLQSGCRIAYDPALTVFHRIPRARLRRAYFCRVVWDKGEGEALAAGPFSGPCLFGAPRWLYRQATELFVRSTLRTIARRPKAFNDVLDCIAVAGTLWGYIKRSHWERQRRGGRGLSDASDVRAAR